MMTKNVNNNYNIAMTNRELERYSSLRDLLFGIKKIPNLSERELNMYTAELNKLSKKYIEHMKQGHKSTFEMTRKMRDKLDRPVNKRW